MPLTIPSNNQIKKVTSVLNKLDKIMQNAPTVPHFETVTDQLTTLGKMISAKNLRHIKNVYNQSEIDKITTFYQSGGESVFQEKNRFLALYAITTFGGGVSISTAIESQELSQLTALSAQTISASFVLAFPDLVTVDQSIEFNSWFQKTSIRMILKKPMLIQELLAAQNVKDLPLITAVIYPGEAEDLLTLIQTLRHLKII